MTKSQFRGGPFDGEPLESDLGTVEVAFFILPDHVHIAKYRRSQEKEYVFEDGSLSCLHSLCGCHCTLFPEEEMV